MDKVDQVNLQKNLQINPHKFIEKSRARKRLDRVLKQIFTIGCYDNAPIWYWMCVEKTLMQVDNIIKHTSFIDLEDDMYIDDCDTIDEGEVELDDFEYYDEDGKLSECTIINKCWKLLDKFYYKTENMNLFYIRRSLIYMFCKLYHEFENDYGSTKPL